MSLFAIIDHPSSNEIHKSVENSFFGIPSTTIPSVNLDFKCFVFHLGIRIVQPILDRK